ncbi:MAG: hydrogenase maturation protease [Acidimicrobiales bacterium]
MSRKATLLAPVIVVGVGNPMRHDDGVGPAAIAHLKRKLLGEHIELMILDGEPTRLLEAWRGRRRAIVIDAACKNAAAGSIHRIEVGADPLPGWAVRSSSHSAGLIDAVNLARTLEVLPEELIVFGVEPADLTLGEGMSDEVQAALPSLIEQIIIEAQRPLFQGGSS